MIWLNGGPGFSSLFGFFAENGPFRIDREAMKAGKSNFIKDNPFSWHNVAGYLVFDQPADTGLSFAANKSSAPETDVEATAQLYNGIKAFLANHPEFQHRKLYIFGESFAGHYIPEVATLILKMNHQLHASSSGGDADFVINLSGIGIGDGWIDPAIQTPNMLAYLFEQSALTLYQMNVATKMLMSCMTAIAAHTSGEEPASVNKICMDYRDYLGKASGRNIFDIRRPQSGYDFNYVGDYLNRDEVRKAIHAVPVAEHKWFPVSTLINKCLSVGEQNSTAKLFHGLLEKMPVILYFGVQDVCCNYPGTVAWLETINWSGKALFSMTKAKQDIRDGRIYQTHRHSGHLTLYTFLNSGHMVPSDQPADVLSMLHNFLYPKEMAVFSPKPVNATTPYRIQ